LQIGNMTLPSIKMLKSMRGFLKLVSGRWLIACEFITRGIFITLTELLKHTFCTLLMKILLLG
jgi:hypothetical protein